MKEDQMAEQGAETAGTAEKKTGAKQEMLSFILHTAIFLAVFLLIVQFIARPVVVQGQSMESTCKDGDYVIIWQLGYQPKHGDIVVTDQNNALDKRLFKRVIAIGGDHLEIRNGELRLNGELQQEDYIKEQNWGAATELEMTIPEGRVFLMGDNRNDSADSRMLGHIANKNIMGKVVVRLFPFNRIGSV